MIDKHVKETVPSHQRAARSQTSLPCPALAPSLLPMLKIRGDSPCLRASGPLWDDASEGSEGAADQKATESRRERRCRNFGWRIGGLPMTRGALSFTFYRGALLLLPY